MLRKIEKQYFYIHECETRINIQNAVRSIFRDKKTSPFLHRIIPRFIKSYVNSLKIYDKSMIFKKKSNRNKYCSNQNCHSNDWRRTRETKRKNERTNGNAKFRKIEEVDSGARDPREEGNFETEPPPPPPPYVRTRGLSHCSRIMAPLYTRVVPIMSRTGDAWNAYEEKRPCLREQHRHPALPALPPSQTWERGSRRYPPPPAAVVHLQTRPESRWAGTCVIGRPRRESFLVPWLELNRAWKKIRWEKSRGSFPCVFVYFRVWRNGDGWTCTYSRLSRDRARKKGNN